MERLIRDQLPLAVFARPQQTEETAARDSELEHGADVLAAGRSRGCSIAQVRSGLRLGQWCQQELTLERVVDHDPRGVAWRERGHDAGEVAVRAEFFVGVRHDAPQFTTRAGGVERLAARIFVQIQAGVGSRREKLERLVGTHAERASR